MLRSVTAFTSESWTAWMRRAASAATVSSSRGSQLECQTSRT